MSARIHTLATTVTQAAPTGPVVTHQDLRLPSIPKSIEDRTRILVAELQLFDLFPAEKITDWYSDFKKNKLSTEDGLDKATIQLCDLISNIVRPAFMLTIDQAEKRKKLLYFDDQITMILQLSIKPGENVKEVITQNATFYDEADVALPEFVEQEQLILDAIADLTDVGTIVDNMANETSINSTKTMLKANEERKQSADNVNATLDKLDERIDLIKEAEIASMKALALDMKREKANRDRILGRVLGVLPR